MVFVSIIQLKNCLTYFQKLEFKTFGKNLNLKLNYIQPKKVQNCSPAGRTETPQGFFLYFFYPEGFFLYLFSSSFFLLFALLPPPLSNTFYIFSVFFCSFCWLGDNWHFCVF